MTAERADFAHLHRTCSQSAHRSLSSSVGTPLVRSLLRRTTGSRGSRSLHSQGSAPAINARPKRGENVLRTKLFSPVPLCPSSHVQPAGTFDPFERGGHTTVSGQNTETEVLKISQSLDSTFPLTTRLEYRSSANEMPADLLRS